MRGASLGTEISSSRHSRLEFSVSNSQSRAMMVTESNVVSVVKGIRDGTTRIAPEQTSVLWRSNAASPPGTLDVSSPDAVADFIEAMFFDPSVEGVKIIVLD
jgi:hypothetical protein